MAERKEEGSDFYAVLGLNKDCSDAELRNAYKKLALKWHPDRCAHLDNPKDAEDSKEHFQAIQEAYSVLSDSNKRFLYDVGLYDDEQEELQNGYGMHDFLGEMATMMNEASSPVGAMGEYLANGLDSFEALQDLFEEMFPGNFCGFDDSTSKSRNNTFDNSSNKCNNRRIYSNKMNVVDEGKSSVRGLSDLRSFESDDLNNQVFCFGVAGTTTESRSRGTKHKTARKAKSTARQSS